MDESLGMRRGKESGKKQSYKARRDESYGMKGKKMLGHEKKPMKCNAFAAQKYDMGKINKKPMEMRGYPRQAWDYKY